MREIPEYIARQHGIALWAALASTSLISAFVGGCGAEFGLEAGDDAPICGDGVQAPGEACDDGNLIAGDGCSPECVVSGTHRECTTIVEGDWLNRANALLPLADGTFMVAGESMRGIETRGWIGRFDQLGEQLWFRQVVPVNTGDGSGVFDLVPDGQDGNWALTSNGERAELLHFDASGSTDRSVDISSVFNLPVHAYAIEFDQDRLWIGGTSEGDMWLGRYDLQSDLPNGQANGQANDPATTIMLEDYRGYDDRIHALSRSGGQLGVAATVSTSPNGTDEFEFVASTDIMLIRLDLAGDELARTTWAADQDSAYARVAEALIPNPDEEGQWFVGGSLSPISTAGQVPTGQVQSWVGRIEPTPSWSWTTNAAFGDEDSVEFGGAAVIDGAVVLAAGAAVGGGQGWLVNFNGDGELGWRQITTASLSVRYEDQQLAVMADDQLRVVTKAWKPGDTSTIESCLVAW
jgi:cysteine-rich repeat protein